MATYKANCSYGSFKRGSLVQADPKLVEGLVKRGVLQRVTSLHDKPVDKVDVAPVVEPVVNEPVEKKNDQSSDEKVKKDS